MQGASGAYASSNSTIYLNANWLESANNDQVIAVLSEEFGTTSTHKSTTAMPQMMKENCLQYY